MTQSLVHLCILLSLNLIWIHKSTASFNIKSLQNFGEWKDIEFKFPTTEERQASLSDGHYIPNNGLAIDVDVDYKEEGLSRVFITIPRFQTGVPFSLGTISNEYGPNGPILDAYPNYAWHSSHGLDCDGITSVFRVAIDECQRLWVVDTGRIGDNQMCPPQILLFNLVNDKLLHRYRFPINQYIPGVSLFVTPVVNVHDPYPGGTCANTNVYIADVTGFAIMVYDYSQNKSWRVNNKLVFPNPTYGTITLAGEMFDLMDGVIGLALTPKDKIASQFAPFQQNDENTFPGNDRILYFHSLASNSENSIRTCLLENSTIWEQNPNAIPRSFIEIGDRGTQSAAQAMDKNGNLYFGLINPIGIACWDSTKPYIRENMSIVAQDDRTLQFVSGLKVITNKYGREELWVLSCRFQRTATGTRNPNEVNFQIQALLIDELLEGNKCPPGGFPADR